MIPAQTTGYEIIDLKSLHLDPSQTVLLFCFGRRIPLEAYLEAYPSVAAILIIGDRGEQIAEPVPTALEATSGWEVRLRTSVRGAGDLLCLGYHNLACGTPDVVPSRESIFDPWPAASGPADHDHEVVRSQIE